MHKVKFSRIIKRVIKARFYVQMVLEGLPYKSLKTLNILYTTEDKEIVGLDLGFRTIAISTESF